MTTTQVKDSGSPLGSNIASLVSLLGLFKQGGQTITDTGGTSTETTQTNLTPQATDALIKSMLSSANGMAAVSSGGRQAGMYNSATNKLLQDNLMASIMSQIAATTAPKTTTKTSTPATRTVNNNAPLGGGLGKVLLGTALARSAFAKDKQGKSPAGALMKLLGIDTEALGLGGGSVDAPLSFGFDPGDSGSFSLLNGNSGITNLDLFQNPELLFSSVLGAGGESTPVDTLNTLLQLSPDSDMFSAAGTGIEDGISSLAAGYLNGVDQAEYLSSLGFTDTELANMSFNADTGVFSTDGFTFDGAGLLDGAGAVMPYLGALARLAGGDGQGAIQQAALVSIPVVGPFIAAIDSATGGSVTSFLDDAGEDLSYWGNEIGDPTIGWMNDAENWVFDHGGSFLEDAWEDIGDFFSDLF